VACQEELERRTARGSRRQVRIPGWTKTGKEGLVGDEWKCLYWGWGSSRGNGWRFWKRGGALRLFQTVCEVSLCCIDWTCCPGAEELVGGGQ
jgi:hypothetical protein